MVGIYIRRATAMPVWNCSPKKLPRGPGAAGAVFSHTVALAVRGTLVINESYRKLAMSVGVDRPPSVKANKFFTNDLF